MLAAIGVVQKEAGKVGAPVFEDSYQPTARYERFDVTFEDPRHTHAGECGVDHQSGIQLLPHMRAQRSGHVINISSVGGYRAAAGFGVYSATKFAVEGLSEALEVELAPLGIRVTVVEPGYFRTDFLDEQSLTRAKIHIADYHETAGAVRNIATERNHNQQGDPARLAKVLMSLVRSVNPPLRLPLGSDTVAAIEDKNRKVAQELAQWRDVALSTDFPRV
jgi:NAD(P)-dependent dehydrogenase (short-subunit alcohol dehydrogenase family)